MNRELNFVVDILSFPNKKGEQKVKKKDMVFRECIDVSSEVKAIREYIRGTTGTIDKKKSIFIMSDGEQRTVLLPYEEARKFKITDKFKNLGSKK